ncbi:MAG: ethanolamine utilization protein EutP [Firmicutes bacterium]|nr:ethanolamine utilization protein EutP [Bacillota bacterium]
MRKLFLCGRSEAGKTTLTQALKGEKAHYVKTQYVKTWDITIDTPGEYAETKALALALGCFSFDSDVVGLLCGADEPYNLFDPAIGGVVNRPMIGIITKIDDPKANVPMVRQWLEDAGCERIFTVDSVTGSGVEELRDYLMEEKKILSMEEVMENQRKGLKDWA